MAQTSYSSTPAPGIPGMLADASSKRVSTRFNENAGGEPFGIFLKEGVNAIGADEFALVTDALAGVSVKSDAHAIDGLTGIQSIAFQDVFDCLEEGCVWVLAEQTMVRGDDVFVRFANGAGGAGATNQKGAVRKDSDTNTCMFVKGARVVRGGVAADGATKMAQVVFSKQVQQTADMVEIPFNHAGAIAATTTIGLDLTHSKRHMVVDEVVYNNPTGFVQDAANDWAIEIKRGATSIAKWDTTTPAAGQGTIAADTYVTLVNAVLANRVVAPGTRLDLVLTKLNAPANLTAGGGVIRAHYI